MQQVIKISTALAAIGFESVTGHRKDKDGESERTVANLAQVVDPLHFLPKRENVCNANEKIASPLKNPEIVMNTSVASVKLAKVQDKPQKAELPRHEMHEMLEQFMLEVVKRQRIKTCNGHPDYVLAKAEIKINGNSHKGEYAIKDIFEKKYIKDIFEKKKGPQKVSAYITKLVEMKSPQDSSNTATRRSKDVRTAAKYLCGILKTFPSYKPSNFEDQWKLLVIKAKKVAKDELYKKHAFAKGHGSTSVTKLDGAKKITGDRKNQHIKSASKVTGKTGRKGSFTAQTTKKGVTGKITNQENHQAIMLEKLREDAAPAAGKASQKAKAVTGPNKARSKKKAKKVPKKSASKVTGKTGREGSFTARTINNGIAKNVSTDLVLKSKKEGTADKITDKEAYDRIQKLKSRQDGAGAADQDRLSRTKGRNMPRSGKAHKHDPSKKMSSEGSPEI